MCINLIEMISYTVTAFHHPEHLARPVAPFLQPHPQLLVQGTDRGRAQPGS